ncbi:MAG: hypothetical protein EA379_11070 [Phycisphaerales bacterium]|nr:MAG: hypothetical protein EA379_11070 [Phycisphaerales bacterium]
MRTSLIAATAVLALASGHAAAQSTNVCPDGKFAWAENIGWLNFRDANAGAQGVRVFNNHLRGWVWGENVGWINVGSGSGPYANTNGTNFGVNVDPSTGELSGFAWGENIGWVNFGTTASVGSQGARFDFSARRFRGYAWGENVGWINLDNSTHFVKALIGDANGDGVVDFGDLSLVLANFGQSGANLPGDVTGNGVVDFGDLSLVLSLFGQGC